MPTSAAVIASSSRPAASSTHARIRERPADVVADAEVLRDRQGGIEVLQRALGVAGDAAVRTPRIKSVALDVPRADRSRERERFLGQHPRLLEPAAEHHDMGEPGRRPRPRLGRRLRRDQVHGGPVGPLRELGLAGDPGVTAESLVQQRDAYGILGLLGESDRALDVRHGPCRLMESGDPGEGREQIDAVAAHPGLGVGDVIPEVDRPLVLIDGLRVCVPRLGRGSGRDRRFERTWQVMGRVPVVGQLRGMGRVASGSRLERPGERRVQTRPLARQQVVVDRLLQQGVPERVALGAGGRIRDEHLAADALAQGFVEGGFVHRCRDGKQRRVDALPGCRGDAQELLGRLGEVGDAGKQHVAQGRGQLRPAVVPRGDEQLFGEERVATGAGVDRVEEHGLEIVPGDRAKLVRQFARIEGLELKSLDAAAPFQLRDEWQ